MDDDHTSDATPPTTSNDDTTGLSNSSAGGSTPEEEAYRPKKGTKTKTTAAPSKAKAKPATKTKSTPKVKATTVTLAKKAAPKKKKATGGSAAGATAFKKAPAKKAAPQKARARHNPLVPRERPKANPTRARGSTSSHDPRTDSSSARGRSSEEDSAHGRGGRGGGGSDGGDGTGSGKGEVQAGPALADLQNDAPDGEEVEGGIECFCGVTPIQDWSVRCDGCQRWFHGTCSGISDENNVPEVFECVPCRWKREYGEPSEEQHDEMLRKLPGLCLYRMLVMALRGIPEVLPSLRDIAGYIGCRPTDIEASFDRMISDGFIEAKQDSSRGKRGGKRKATQYVYINNEVSKTRWSHLFNPGGRVEHEEFRTPLISHDKYVGSVTEETLPASQSQRGLADMFPSSQPPPSQRYSQSQPHSQSQTRAAPAAAPQMSSLRETPAIISSSSAPTSESSLQRKRKLDTPASTPNKRSSAMTKPQRSARMVSNVLLERWMEIGTSTQHDWDM